MEVFGIQLYSYIICCWPQIRSLQPKNKHTTWTNKELHEGGRLLAVSHCRGNRLKSSHWILRLTYVPTTPVLVSQLVGGQEALLNGNQGSPPPQSSNKDGRATDSCFALIVAHQCGILMVDVGDWLLLYPPQVKTCGFNRNNKGGYSRHDWSIVKGGDCLQLATVEAIDQRVITGYYICM